jgi:menaquinone-dependent protoporphyrinogen IX oxidase
MRVLIVFGTTEGHTRGLAEFMAARLAACVARFERDTLRTPRAVHHAGGAIRFSRYGLLKRWALRLIARRRGYDADPAKDHDLTDYGALASFVDGFVADLGRRPSRRAVPGGRPPSETA